MAVVAEELISDLIVRDGKLRSGIRSAQQAYGAGVGAMRNDTKRFESEFNRSSASIASGFKSLAATLAAGVSVAATGQLIDSFTRLQNSLRVAGLEGKNLEAVQSDLLDLSTRYGVNIEGLANLYGKATDAGKSFGASQAQILQLTEATSQSLLITGTRAEQASGAILGLSQALASGVVRAEEYNQINEGGLRPLLQAAAATARFGGDINKLRAAVLDGTVTSKEFFNAIMAGSAQLEGQAAKATLTLSGAFEALTSSLTVYVGSAAQTNGVTVALAAGIKTLADNLDTIIPTLAIIAAAIGVRWVAALAASTTATIAQSVATTRAASVQTFLNSVMAESAVIQGIYGSSVVRTTTALGTMSLVARGAGASLLAAFGGPVGVAITAIGAALAYVTYESAQTAAASAALQQQYSDSAAQLDTMIGRLQAAGVSTEDLARISDVAAGRVDKLADSYNRASVEAHKMATAISMATIEMLKQAAVASAAAKADRLDAERQLTQAGGADAYNRTGMRDQYLRPAGGTVIQDLQKRIADARAEERRQAAVQEAALLAFERGVDLGPAPGPPGAAAAGKPKKTPKGRSGPDLAEQAAQRTYREEQELRSLRLEEIRAKEQLAATTEERADLQKDALDLERQAREAEIAEGIRRKELTLDQAQAQLEIVNSLYGTAAVLNEQGDIVAEAKQSLYGAAIAAEAMRKAEEERASLSQTQADIQRDELQFAYDMADTNSERRDIALQMIELDAREQRAKLEGIIAVEKIGSLRRREAEALLAALDGQTARARDRANRDTENPLERLSRESNLTAEQMTEAFQDIEARGLTSLSDGITDVIMQTRSLGDVFKSVANQIIADLIRIAVQKFIVNSLVNVASSVFGGGSGLTGTSGGMDLRGFRAGGGPVSAGQLYRVNEGQQEYFRPASDGRMVPLSQAQAARPGGSGNSGPVIVQLAVAAGEMFVPTVTSIAGDVSIRTVQATAPGIVRAAVSETTRRVGRPRT